MKSRRTEGMSSAHRRDDFSLTLPMTRIVVQALDR